MFANCYKGRRVFITGHTGFKGSWLAAWLSQMGATVCGFADCVPTSPSHFEAMHLEQHVQDMRGDIRDRDAVVRAMKEFRPDVVFHLAAQALVRKSYEDAPLTFEANMLGTLNMLEAVRQCPSVEAAVFITSDKCYRNDEWVWGYRETDHLGGDDPYSASKGCAEIIAHSYFKSFFKDGPACATVRAGNVIGGGDWAADRIVPDCARAWFRKIEQGDAEAVDLWQRMKTLTLKEVGEVYKLLGVEFDSYNGESFYEDKMQAVIDELDAKGLLKTDKGAKIVDLSEYNMPPCIIVKSDGATLYATRDLAAAIYRKNTYDFVKSIYVVAYQQNLHFQQFFKVLELMGKTWVKDCVHVNFGMVSMEEGTLSTRHGNVVYLEDVLNASIEKTLDIIKEKSPDLEDKEAAARAVGVGAVVWGILYNSRIKDTSFSWSKMLNFDGETGPYAQYTHARCCSVLRKANGYDKANVDCSLLSGEAETALIKAIAAFPETVKAAAEKYEPYLISREVIDVCSCFNKFYYDCRIMDDDPAVRNARLALCDAARICIKNGLYLIGLEAPERM